LKVEVFENKEGLLIALLGFISGFNGIWGCVVILWIFASSTIRAIQGLDRPWDRIYEFCVGYSSGTSALLLWHLILGLSLALF
jgi:hypothetical protein